MVQNKQVTPWRFGFPETLSGGKSILGKAHTLDGGQQPPGDLPHLWTGLRRQAFPAMCVQCRAGGRRARLGVMAGLSTPGPPVVKESVPLDSSIRSLPS